MHSGRYVRVSADKLGLGNLRNAKITRMFCKGKLIVFQLEANGEPIAILSTLGMTGWWETLGPNHRAEDPHDPLTKYRRIDIELNDGSRLSFFDPRNFGTIKVVSHAEMKRKLAELGPDIMTPDRLWNSISIPEFITRARRFGRKLTVAEGLLDQRIACGCGNYIRADAMNLATLSPLHNLATLTDEQLTNLWRALGIIGHAAYNDKHAGRYQFRCYHQGTTPSGNLIESYKDKNGRTVWWCPIEQK